MVVLFLFSWAVFSSALTTFPRASRWPTLSTAPWGLQGSAPTCKPRWRWLTAATVTCWAQRGAVIGCRESSCTCNTLVIWLAFFFFFFFFFFFPLSLSDWIVYFDYLQCTNLNEWVKPLPSPPKYSYEIHRYRKASVKFFKFFAQVFCCFSFPRTTILMYSNTAAAAAIITTKKKGKILKMKLLDLFSTLTLLPLTFRSQVSKPLHLLLFKKIIFFFRKMYWLKHFELNYRQPGGWQQSRPLALRLRQGSSSRWRRCTHNLLCLAPFQPTGERRDDDVRSMGGGTVQNCAADSQLHLCRFLSGRCRVPRVHGRWEVRASVRLVSRPVVSGQELTGTAIPWRWGKGGGAIPESTLLPPKWGCIKMGNDEPYCNV